MKKYREYLNIQELDCLMTTQKCIFVDSRDNEVYSGWSVNGCKRGGHIPGALDLFSLLDMEESTKSIIILYGEKKEQIETAFQILTTHGYEKIYFFLVDEWFKTQESEWEVYPNYQLYLPAEIVHNLLLGKFPSELRKTQDVKIVEVGWGKREESDYMSGHVPGAVYINTDEFEPPKTYVKNVLEWRLAPDEVLLNLLLDNGITCNTTVIVTGREMSAVCRFAVICKYLGVEEVYAMSRALEGWKERGYPLSCKIEEPTKKETFGCDIPQNKKWIETLDEVKENRKNPNYMLVDVRSWEEYQGNSAGYDYHDIAGHIPNSTFGGLKKNTENSMSTYRNKDLTMKNPITLRKLWEKNGIDMSKHLSFFCGSGWRAAEVLWDTKVMGLEDVSLFSDGWIAWSNEGNPICQEKKH